MSTPVVLISPAMAIGSRFYRPLVAEFESRGWAARALPRRGFELDDVPASREEDWSYGDEIADLAEAVADARADFPGRPVIVLGHSLGGQLTLGLTQTSCAIDGLVTVGTSLPHHRHFPWGGPHLVVMAGVVVPLLTATTGHVPKPAFGAPGARTLMRQWARMALTGRTPFQVTRPVSTPALVVSLDGDTYAPEGSVDAFTRRFFDPRTTTRFHLLDTEVAEGVSNHHTGWVRTPEAVVERIVEWWGTSNG